jgi:hypothetical protein
MNAVPSMPRRLWSEGGPFEGRRGEREACLCTAVLSSAGPFSVGGRRVLRVDYASPRSRAGRPELRVVDAITNLCTAEEWYAMALGRCLAVGLPVHRLGLDNWTCSPRRSRAATRCRAS